MAATLRMIDVEIVRAATVEIDVLGGLAINGRAVGGPSVPKNGRAC